MPIVKWFNDIHNQVCSDVVNKKCQDIVKDCSYRVKHYDDCKSCANNNSTIATECSDIIYSKCYLRPISQISKGKAQKSKAYISSNKEWIDFDKVKDIANSGKSKPCSVDTVIFNTGKIELIEFKDLPLYNIKDLQVTKIKNFINELKSNIKNKFIDSKSYFEKINTPNVYTNILVLSSKNNGYNQFGKAKNIEDLKREFNHNCKVITSDEFETTYASFL